MKYSRNACRKAEFHFHMIVILISKNSFLLSKQRWELGGQPKAGVIAKFNVNAWLTSFDKNHPCTFKSHSPGSSQIMMNISEQFVDFVWVTYQRPFFVLLSLSTLCIYIYFISTEIYPQRWQWWKSRSVFSRSQSATWTMKFH